MPRDSPGSNWRRNVSLFFCFVYCKTIIISHLNISQKGSDVNMSVLTEIQRLARKSCACFTGSDGCLHEPNGQSRCNFFRTDAQARQYVEDDTMRCFVFERGVLPTDPVLERQYFGDTGAVDRCEKCRTRIVKRSNRQKYCASCAGEAAKRRSRDSMRRKSRVHI